MANPSNGESIGFTPLTRTQAQETLNALKRNLRQSANMQDLLFAHVQWLRDKLIAVSPGDGPAPAGEHAEIRADSAALLAAVRHWDLIQDRIERIRASKRKKDGPVVPVEAPPVNKAPEFDLPNLDEPHPATAPPLSDNQTPV